MVAPKLPGPVQGALYGALPFVMERLTLVCAHLWLECAVYDPVLGYFLLAAPEANRQARQVSGTQGCGFRDFGALYSDTQDVSLELHEEVIDDCAAVNAQCLHVDTTVGSHSFQHVSGLVTHGFQGGTSHVSYRRASREADNGAACVGVPVWRAQTYKRWYQIDTAIVRLAGGQRLDIYAVLDSLQSIAQP